MKTKTHNKSIKFARLTGVPDALTRAAYFNRYAL